MNTILIVDDLRFARTMLRIALQNDGFRVIEALDGVQALQVIADARPDAVITNLVLPRLGGLDLLRTIRADGCSMPVIVMALDPPGADVNEIATLGPCRVVPATGAPGDAVDTLKTLLPERQRATA